MNDRLNDILNLLRRLDTAGIYFELARPRDEALMILVAVPGERWEIEYLEDGTIEVEIFRSNGELNPTSRIRLAFGFFRSGDPGFRGHGGPSAISHPL